MQWTDWESGDTVCAPDQPGAVLDPDEVVRRVAPGFRKVVIDRRAGDRWVRARVEAAERAGYQGALLDAERALVGRVALVSVSDEPGLWVRFHLSPDAGLLELNYGPAGAVAAGRAVSVKLAGLLGYDFVPGAR